MVKKQSGNIIGAWSFLIGVILAIALGLVGLINPLITTILVVIGLLVGLLNIADEEVHPFLFSGVSLILASFLGQNIISNLPALDRVLEALSIIFVPATIIVAIRNVFSLAKN